MASQKFVLPALEIPPSTNPHGEVVRVSMDAYNHLIEMVNKSSLTIKDVVSMAIEYAYDNLAYKKEEE